MAKTPEGGRLPAKGQAQIPGTERQTIPELQELAVDRAAQVALWQEHQKAAGRLDAQIRELMLELADDLPRNGKGEPFYRFEDEEGITRDVTLQKTERLKIAVTKAELE